MLRTIPVIKCSFRNHMSPLRKAIYCWSRWLGQSIFWQTTCDAEVWLAHWLPSFPWHSIIFYVNYVVISKYRLDEILVFFQNSEPITFAKHRHWFGTIFTFSPTRRTLNTSQILSISQESCLRHLVIPYSSIL